MRTLPPAGREIPLSSAETETAPETEEEPEEVPEVDEAREELISRLEAEVGDGAIVERYIVPGVDAWVRIATDQWTSVIEAARDKLGMTYFDFLSGMDWMESPWGRNEDSTVDVALGNSEADGGGYNEEINTGYAGGDTRFQVFARLSNVIDHTSLTFKVDLPDESLDSIVELFPGASWHEREVWEMFGIDFPGHPGLRALYLPADFEGHPLRKDFPLLSRHIKPWPGIVDVEPMPGDGDEEDTKAESGS